MWFLMKAAILLTDTFAKVVIAHAHWVVPRGPLRGRFSSRSRIGASWIAPMKLGLLSDHAPHDLPWGKGRFARGGAHAKAARHHVAVARSRHGDSVLAWRMRGVALSPEHFRQKMAGSAERLDADQPLRDAGATFRERAAACLNATTKRYGGPAEGSNGAYIFLANASPLGARRTHLALWTYAWRGDALRNAVKGCVSGSVSGCPDLS